MRVKDDARDLSAVLRSHPMIHTVEGALFRQAISAACQAEVLTLIFGPRARSLAEAGAAAWGLKEPALRSRIDALRKSAGAPWGSDQKRASAFAVLALK